KEVAGVVAEEGTSNSTPEMTPAYRRNLNKLIKLAEKLPNSLVLNSNSSNVENTNEEVNSSASVKDTESNDNKATDLVKPNSTKSNRKGLTSSDDNPKYSRGEKKARRLLMKLDLKPIEGVFKVTMKKSKNILLIIDNPEVFQTPTGTVIIFGKATIEDLANSAATRAAERYREAEASKEKEAEKEAATVAAEGAAADDDDGDDVDEAAAMDLDEKDIELVLLQASCSRKRAIKALLQNGRDVVNAIMDLTMS
ncbi:hypothetical protein KR200_004539, partial [Drosophila serrata]